jgi:hypothetical protein
MATDLYRLRVSTKTVTIFRIFNHKRRASIGSGRPGTLSLRKPLALTGPGLGIFVLEQSHIFTDGDLPFLAGVPGIITLEMPVLK